MMGISRTFQRKTARAVFALIEREAEMPGIRQGHYIASVRIKARKRESKPKRAWRLGCRIRNQ